MAGYGGGGGYGGYGGGGGGYGSWHGGSGKGGGGHYKGGGDDDGAEAFVTYAQGRLKVFNSAKNFGFIQPIWRNEDAEGPPLKLAADEGLWFFGNHSLTAKTQTGCQLTFEVWENSEGKPQARCVQPSDDTGVLTQEAKHAQSRGEARQRRHANEPRVIYPSVYISDVPVEYTEDTLKELHRSLGLNPDAIMGLKFLPFTEVSLGSMGEDGKPKSVAPVTGSVILRYLNEEAAHAAVDRLRGHPIRTSSGATKYLGARHAAPAKWMQERKSADIEDKKQMGKQGELMNQKLTGVVVRVSAAGYGVIKSRDWGEVMWRQYELPTNLRSMQFADPNKFQQEVQSRPDYKRLKEMEGKEVEAELYRLPDGQIRASHVRSLGGPPSLEGPSGADAGAKSSTQTPPLANEGGPSGVVCVRPVPPQWSDAELWERFEWYGSLTEASVVRRLRDDKGQKPPDGEPVWTLGVLFFEDAKCAEEVIRHENGGSLDGHGSVVVEAGLPVRTIGMCEGVVMQYLPEHGIGLLRSAQVNGDVHFEASPDMKSSGMDLRGMRVDANVVYGGDGVPQAKEVKVKDGSATDGAPPPPPPPPPLDGDASKSGKKRKHDHAQASMPNAAMYPGMMMPGPGGAMPGPNDPYFKTQPCPYLRMGTCQMGSRCYFAHSPEELRAAPEAMMMSHFARMMGTSGGKKEKKEKKEKKRKREEAAEDAQNQGEHDRDLEQQPYLSSRRRDDVDESPHSDRELPPPDRREHRGRRRGAPPPFAPPPPPPPRDPRDRQYSRSPSPRYRGGRADYHGGRGPPEPRGYGGRRSLSGGRRGGRPPPPPPYRGDRYGDDGRSPEPIEKGATAKSKPSSRLPPARKRQRVELDDADF